MSKENGKTDNKIKRFSLETSEREKLQNLQSVMGILSLLREGLNHSIILEIARVRNRLKIREEDAPKGFVRTVDFDPEKYELLVIDVPIVEKPAEPVKGANEAKKENMN